MRALPMLAFALLVPVASAQLPAQSGSLALTVEPYETWLAPDGPPLSAPITLIVGCDAGRVAPATSVTFSVVRVPAWADVEIVPSVAEAEAQLCPSSFLEFRAELVARATHDAPAFTPELVEVEALVTQPMREPLRTTTGAPLSAGFFSILDVKPESAVVAIPAEGGGELEVVFTNFGNADTRVEVEVTPLAPGVVVEDPAPFVLQSRHTGGTAIAKTVRLEIERTQDVGEPIPVKLSWRSHYVFERAIGGDAGELSFVVTREAGAALDAASFADEIPARVPMPPVGAVLALALALALALRRR